MNDEEIETEIAELLDQMLGIEQQMLELGGRLKKLKDRYVELDKQLHWRKGGNEGKDGGGEGRREGEDRGWPPLRSV